MGIDKAGKGHKPLAVDDIFKDFFRQFDMVGDTKDLPSPGENILFPQVPGSIGLYLFEQDHGK